MRDASAITGYHAHVYYDGAEERAVAAAIREATETKFQVRMGRWREEPVGPHPLPMFQIAFEPEVFPEIVPWLMINRGELSILVHPETGDDLEDHRDHALWLGEKLDLVLKFLEDGNTSA